MLRCCCWDYFFLPYKGFVRIVQVSFNTCFKYDYPFDVMPLLPFEDYSGNQLLMLETNVVWTQQEDHLTEQSYLKC